MIWNNPRFNKTIAQSSKVDIPLKRIEDFVNQEPAAGIDRVRQKINILNHKGKTEESKRLAVRNRDIPLNELPFSMECHVLNTGYRVDKIYVEALATSILQSIKVSGASHIVLLGDDVMQCSFLQKVLNACRYSKKKIIIKFAQCVNLSAIPDEFVPLVDLLCVYKPKWKHKKYLARFKCTVRVYPAPKKEKKLSWWTRLWSRNKAK